MYAIVTATVLFGIITLLNLVLTVGLVRKLRAEPVHAAHSSGTGSGGQPGGLHLGDAAPDLGAFATAGGRTLVGIFSTDCGACPDYLPRFRQRAESFDGAAVAILGGKAPKVDQYRDALGSQVVLVPDAGDGPMASGALTAGFEITVWPSFFLLDEDGTVTAAGTSDVLDVHEPALARR